MRIIPLLGAIIIAFAFAASWRVEAQSETAGQAVVPLLSCPNVDASSDNRVDVADIVAVRQSFGQDWPSVDYTFLHDLVAPYDPGLGTGGHQNMSDVLAVIERYYEVCPAVDGQVARAVRAITDDPQAAELRTCDVDVLAERGYTVEQFNVDVPGQGIHYVNLNYWDGSFDPTTPGGFVCNDGRLVAELYYVEGDSVGWGPASPPPVDQNNIDAFCLPVCSWSGPYDGWHWHGDMCWLGIGTAQPAFIRTTQQTCEQYAEDHTFDCTWGQTFSSETTCMYRSQVGWMGHLWDFFPNANLVPDVGGSLNGRFADCFPDAQGWTAYNCPQ